MLFILIVIESRTFFINVDALLVLPELVAEMFACLVDESTVGEVTVSQEILAIECIQCFWVLCVDRSPESMCSLKRMLHHDPSIEFLYCVVVETSLFCIRHHVLA